MTQRERRRRALVLLALALACGGLAASQVHDRTQAIERRVGQPVPVVVARADLAAGTKVDRATAKSRLVVHEVPERFAPPDSFATVRDLVGLTTATAVPAGGYLTAAQLERDGRRPSEPGGLAAGERAVEVTVAGAPAAVAGPGSGGRVDVLVTVRPREGAGRTFVALENVELLDVRSAGSDAVPEPAVEGGAARAGAIATLRVSVRQAVYLTAAQNFAQEVRLLVRARSDRARVGPQSIDAAGL